MAQARASTRGISFAQRLKKGDTRALARVSASLLHRSAAARGENIAGRKSRHNESGEAAEDGRGMAVGDRHVGHGDSSFELVLERDAHAQAL